MFFAKIPRHTRQNAITEGDLECILTRNCEGTERLRAEITIQKVVSREVFWHVFCQNPETYKAKCHHRR